MSEYLKLGGYLSSFSALAIAGLWAISQFGGSQMPEPSQLAAVHQIVAPCSSDDCVRRNLWDGPHISKQGRLPYYPNK